MHIEILFLYIGNLCHDVFYNTDICIYLVFKGLQCETNMTKFSVLMPVYHGDSSSQFDDALNSITRNQTLKPSEVVIVVDGPVNWLVPDKVISDYHGYNLNFVMITKNRGLSNALNVGLMHCNFDLVARMDSDDVALPSRFEMQISLMTTQHHIAVLGGAVEEFSYHQTFGRRSCPTDPVAIREYAYLRNPMNHPTVVFRKRLVMRLGGYQEFDGFEDYDLWVRMIQSGHTITNIEEVCVKMRVGKEFYKRRRGLNYIVKEYRFALNIYREGFLTEWSFGKFLMLRLIFRLIPRPFIMTIYSKLLRRY